MNMIWVLDELKIYWSRKTEVDDWKKTGYRTAWVVRSQFGNETKSCIDRRGRGREGDPAGYALGSYSGDFWGVEILLV